ncbi:hypothetical protein [Rubritalea tangerina]
MPLPSPISTRCLPWMSAGIVKLVEVVLWAHSCLLPGQRRGPQKLVCL